MRFEDDEEPTHVFEGQLRVEGIARMAAGVRCTGDVRAPAGVELGEDAIVEGDVYTDGPVQLDRHARIQGSIYPAGGTHPVDLAITDEALARTRSLLAAAERGDPIDETELASVREELARVCLEQPPEDAWPHHLVHHVLYGHLLATAHPVTVETKDREASILRIRETGERSTEAVARVATRLGQAACPSLELHPLSAPDTRGDAVLLVEV